MSGNLIVPAGADGIDVQVNNVTIDLNGFTISGPVTCTGSGAVISCGQFTPTIGIAGVDNRADLTIRLGSVVGFNVGVSTNGFNNFIEEIHATGNQATGIYVYNAVVRRNTSSLSGEDRILAISSTVIENVSVLNGGRGLAAIGNVVYGGNVFAFNAFGAVSNYLSVSQNNRWCCVLKADLLRQNYRSDPRFSNSLMSSVVGCYSGNIPLITIPFQFFIVLKLLSMIVICFIGVPAAAAICFRLLLPLFTVDMPSRHVEPDPFV